MKHTVFILFVLFSISVNAQKTGIKEVDDATVPMYVIIAGASADFNTLDLSVKNISKKTGLKYETYLEYDKKRGMILPDSSDDELYAGHYIPRRNGEDIISIEMMWYYSSGNMSESDTTKMIIVAGIFGDKKRAEAQLKLVKKAVPSAYIKRKDIYMGCMH